jgi:hypothetical protein
VVTRERVVVGLEPDGSPHSVRVLQRIHVKQLGDYVFGIPAPVQKVSAGPGTESPPGRRENQILWQGFSPGRRVLAAWADLRPEDSVGSLPLGVRVETTPAAITMTLTNLTGANAQSYTADSDPISVVQNLDRLRDAVRAGVFAQGLNVTLKGPRRPVRQAVLVPLAVKGTLEAANRSVAFSKVLGASPQTVVLRSEAGSSATTPKVDLTAKPIRLGGLAEPPGGGTWVAAFRRGDLGRDPRRLLARTIELELRYARERQFEMYLANPDPTGPSSTTYVYRTAAAVAAPPPAAGATGDSSHGLGLLLTVLVLALSIPVAAVVWAHL